MSDARQEFIEAMCQMLAGVERQAKSGPHRVYVAAARRACIAFAAAMGHDGSAPSHTEKIGALLREVGLEERDGG